MTENFAIYEKLQTLSATASELHDDGWRAKDRDRLITECDLTAEDADAICEILKDIREKAHNLYQMAMEESIRDAGSLYDGGWRAEDRDQLMSEYDLTSDEADALCEALKDMEEESNASSEDDE